MKKVLSVPLILFPFFCLAQQNLKNIRTSSWQTMVYSISANDAEQFMKWDSIPVKRFENAAPVLTGWSDSLDTDILPVGHYVELNVIDNNVNAVCFNNTNLLVLTVNNKNSLQLDVRTKTGELQTTATAFFKGKQVPFNNDSKTFWVKQHHLDEAMVKICTPGDTTFIELASLEDYHQTISEQRRRNYRSSKIYRILNWLPSKIKSLFKEKRRWKSNRIGASGYIIFNQPKYKPLDTVRFKGYIVDKKWRQYKKPIDVYLNYYDHDKNVDRFLYTLKPVSAGAFTGQFVLADSIPIDISCQLYFKTASKKEILRRGFTIEDYVLDDMGTFNFKADKAIYYKDDSIHFSASSKDANGLNVMDASATLIVTTSSITSFYKDSLFVADTLYREEKKLLTTTDTKFSISTKDFPAADLLLNAKLIFKNSNNELHEEDESINFAYAADDIIVTQDGDSIKAFFKRNGKEMVEEGEVEMNSGDAVKMQFPYRAKIDPVAGDYTFRVKNKTTGKLVQKTITIEGNYRLVFSRVSKGDTLGFDLVNPYKVPVYFSVFNGNKLVAAGKQSGEMISWRKRMSNPRQSYKLRWQYIWAGEEEHGEENIGLLYKLLDIKIGGSESVFPGQKDSIKIEVKDFKGAPAANVNLTAVSYNNQFKKNINVQQPPYLARYKGKHYLLREGFENDGDYAIKKRYALGRNKAWIKTFHLDSMVYYKLLFPAEHYFDAVTLTEEIFPQLSVNVVKQGIPQEIYLLYVNRNLVYYNGATDKANYSFPVMPENVQVGIRLKDKYIEVDSLYIQAHYKHDLSFDLDNMPPHTTVVAAEKYWSNAELALLERTMWQMKDSYISDHAFVWQDNTVIRLQGNKRHLAGPFTPSEMTFYNPGNFDISFNFEHGYEYSLSKQIARLEKKNIFPDKLHKNFLPYYASGSLKLGDTLVAPPLIVYQQQKPTPVLKFTPDSYNYEYYAGRKNNKGRLQYTVNRDSNIVYVVLKKNDDSIGVVLSGYNHGINNVEPGIYSLYLVTNHFYILEMNNIEVNKNGTTCIKTDSVKFKVNNDHINYLLEKQQQKLKPFADLKQPEPEKNYVEPEKIVYTSTNSAIVTGKIIDARGGNPVPFAAIHIKGSKTGLNADAAGNFSMRIPGNGKQILVVSGIGYKTIEMVVDVSNGQSQSLLISLQVSSNELREVVVTGAYGIKRSARSTSVSVSVSGDELQLTRAVNINEALAGKVAGIQIRGQSGELFDAATVIRLHGANSITDSNTLLYVIDGISYKTLPKNFNIDNIADVSVLNGSAATAIFGAAAANGAMVITTKTKTFRKEFRDYAFWQPNFFTDKNGNASFEVTYPDNITGWRTFVVAMDKKRRSGKASVLTQSYKPIVSQLSVPQFLITGDSTELIGKAVNYTADKYKISSAFNVNGNEKKMAQKELNSNASAIDEQMIVANTDTIKTSFSVETTTGFKDGEERKIPVFKKGTTEAVGNFWVLQNDTTVNFSAVANTSELDIYAQNNTLDLLLNEIEHLKEYPYFCMEQIASKLTGYAMEKKIKEQLGQPFKNEDDMNRLLVKLQKAQLFDGSWAWWEKGKSNFYISNYITVALQRFRDNALVETNVRNAFLYLQNQLNTLDKTELLAALSTLSNGNHEMDYSEWMKKIHFDSLTQHQQWQWVQICQQQKIAHQKELKILVDKKIETQLGGTHWGEENYSWHSNEIATTVIAYTVLQNDAAYKYLLPSVIQYFLEKRKGGYWRNTVESASIVNAIIPGVLEQNKNFTEPAVLRFNGDTSFTVTQFPYRLHKNNTAVKSISISKSGGGLVYLTAYQKTFNENPMPVNDKFILHTSFQKNGEEVGSIRSGEKVKMVITINVLKDADYVMVEVPIPAGCIYASKNNGDWKMHKEFYKDKMLLFTESLGKGMHQFEIELEPRYNGTYTLNPAKAELMYYPTFYGRNEMKKVVIAK